MLHVLKNELTKLTLNKNVFNQTCVPEETFRITFVNERIFAKKKQLINYIY